MTEPRNWDKELADIDRVIAADKVVPTGMPARVGAPAPLPSGRSAPPSGAAPRKRDLAWVWLRVLVGLAAAAALPFWPRSHICGLDLYLYLAATAVVTLWGVWIMHGAWKHRRAIAHVSGLLVFLAGLVFMAIPIVQRTSFAAVRLTWTCP